MAHLEESGIIHLASSRADAGVVSLPVFGADPAGELPPWRFKQWAIGGSQVQCGYHCNVIRKRKLIQCSMYWSYDLSYNCLTLLWKVVASSSHWPTSLATFPSWEWNKKSRQLCQPPAAKVWHSSMLIMQLGGRLRNHPGGWHNSNHTTTQTHVAANKKGTFSVLWVIGIENIDWSVASGWSTPLLKGWIAVMLDVLQFWFGPKQCIL